MKKISHYPAACEQRSVALREQSSHRRLLWYQTTIHRREVASGGKYLPPATATEVKVFYYHINYCVLQGFAWGCVANQSAPLTLSVVFVYTNCLCHIAIMNISDLKPGSFLISSLIPLVVFSASSSALDALNPFLAKSMAG